VATTPPRDTTPTPTPAKPAVPAPAPAPAPAPVKTDSAKADSAVKDVWKDGLYFGWGRSRHGDIQAGVEIKAGTTMLLSHMAANRDPRKFENPHTFDMNRKRIKEHLAFGRGAHTCIGNPLARAEVRVLFDRFFEHTARMTIAQAEHGPAEARRLDYEPSYIVRGLTQLHVELTPARVAAPA
jgi:hypothetical protein